MGYKFSVITKRPLLSNRDTGLWRKFFLKYAGRFGAKYAGKICGIWRNMRHVCGITEICGVNDACACVYIGQNAQKCWKMRSHMRKYAIRCDFFANLCI